MTRPASPARPAYRWRPFIAPGIGLLGMVGVLAVTAGHAHAGPMTQGAGASGYSMTQTAPSDVYVQGKYDRNGVYVPPHYVPKRKSAFSAFNNRDIKRHGYFDVKKPGQAPR